jgi:uncharacterized iron-regulated membrane protein
MITRQRFFILHKYCGLAAAFFILLQALTGMMLAYRAELAQLIDPAGMVRRSDASNAPLSAVMGSIQSNFPRFEVQRLFYPRNAAGTYFTHLVNAEGQIRYASIDPGDGRVLRSGGIWSFPLEAALFLHFRLMTGRGGLIIVLLTGLSVLTLTLSGLAYWWPKRGRVRKSLEINSRLPARVVLRQFHRSLGVLISALLLVSATTGIFVGSVFLLASGPLYAVAPSHAPPLANPPYDAMLALARTQFPGHAVRDIRMPAPTAFNISFLAPERNPSAVHSVRINLETRTIIGKVAAQDDSSLWVLILPIHNGALFGTIGRTLVLLLGLALATMAVTGPLMWLQRSRPTKPKIHEARPL